MATNTTTDPYAGQAGARYPVGVARARVAELHAKGLNGPEIARVMGISKQAVYFHLRQLRDAS